MDKLFWRWCAGGSIVMILINVARDCLIVHETLRAIEGRLEEIKEKL